MHSCNLATPLTILVGLGFPREITTVRDAMAYLEGVPAPLRDEAYHAARDACLDALNRRSLPDEAQDVFAAYARRRGILVEGRADGILAAKSGKSLNV